MPVTTRRAASVQPTSVSPTSTSSATASQASSTARLAPPLTRRQTRSSTTEPTSSRSTSIFPPLTASTTPDSLGQTPSTPPSPSSSSTSEREMFGRDGTGMRGRNVEDLGELEEKGLLRRNSPDKESSGLSSPRKRRGQGSVRGEKEGSLERIILDEGKEGEGLTSTRDKQAFALLILLCIPLGLTFGTLPFLLKPHLSYSQLAIFALSTWPYSLKLLWSPIVDAWFVPRWGRRKSWIVPVQAVVGAGMWWIGGRVEGWLNAEEVDIRFITMIFGSLILAAATQDIAVDGWALTLLSAPNLSYASTAQTIGLGIGNALAFTVFLAFNSVDFSNRYFRSQPLPYGLLSLGSYMRFWALVFVGVTLALALYKREDPVSEDDPDMDVKKVYRVMWSIVRLKNIQSFLLIHLVCKIGFQVNESVTSLKLLEKGLSKEDMAIAALLDFPAQMVAGWLAAKWSRPSSNSVVGAKGGGQVLRPWIWAFWARLVMASIAGLVVYGFPRREVGRGYFVLVIATTLLSSLASTVQFVGITAFHTQIADPLIGGTYMTLLNTVSNLGGTWPKPLILRSVDVLTKATCSIGGLECVSEHGKHVCEKLGGHCVVTRDGYYIMSAAGVLLSVGLLMGFILPTVKRLQDLHHDERYQRFLSIPPDPFLFLTNAEAGQANVHLAIIASLLQFHATEVEIHLASFETLRPRCPKGVDFHPISGRSMKQTHWPELLDQAAQIGTGFLLSLTLARNLIPTLIPYTPTEYVNIAGSTETVLQSIQPDWVVVDSLFQQGVDAVRKAGWGGRYCLLSPNSLKDVAGCELGLAGLAYPLVGISYSYPVPLHLRPLNILSTLHLGLYIEHFDPHARAINAARNKAGYNGGLPMPHPEHEASVLCMTTPVPGLDYPMDVPDRVVRCGPIVQPSRKVEYVDPELWRWLDNGRTTILISLGTHFKLDQKKAEALWTGVKAVLDIREDVQVLWKLSKKGEYEVGSKAEKDLYGDRLRIVDWLEPEPVEMLRSGRIGMVLHHGGSDSYHEALAAGVPQIILSSWIDTHDFGARLGYVGVGKWANKLSAPNFDAHEISTAFFDVIGRKQDDKRTEDLHRRAELCAVDIRAYHRDHELLQDYRVDSKVGLEGRDLAAEWIMSRLFM